MLVHDTISNYLTELYTHVRRRTTLKLSVYVTGIIDCLWGRVAVCNVSMKLVFENNKLEKRSKINFSKSKIEEDESHRGATHARNMGLWKALNAYETHRKSQGRRSTNVCRGVRNLSPEGCPEEMGLRLVMEFFVWRVKWRSWLFVWFSTLDNMFGKFRSEVPTAGWNLVFILLQCETHHLLNIKTVSNKHVHGCLVLAHDLGPSYTKKVWDVIGGRSSKTNSLQYSQDCKIKHNANGLAHKTRFRGASHPSKDETMIRDSACASETDWAFWPVRGQKYAQNARELAKSQIFRDHQDRAHPL